MPRANTEEHFWETVDKTEGGCWLRTSGFNRAGYTQFRWNGRLTYSHRLAYELLVGPIPEGLTLDHLCRVRNCVNPDHLEPVPGRINILRGVGPAAIHAAKTHCPQGHPYSGVNLYVNKRGWRGCRTCMRASASAYKRRKRAAA